MLLRNCVGRGKLVYKSHLVKKQTTLDFKFCSRCGANLGVNEDYDPKTDHSLMPRQNGEVCSAPYIENTTPFFNRGLGCITNGTRHAEKIAKQKGLIPVGDTPINRDHLKPVFEGKLREAYREMRQGKRF